MNTQIHPINPSVFSLHTFYIITIHTFDVDGGSTAAKPIWISWTLDDKISKLYIAIQIIHYILWLDIVVSLLDSCSYKSMLCLVEGKQPVLRSGESIREAVKSVVENLSPNGPVEGLLFNCSSPEVITAALPILEKEISSLKDSVRIGAYANGFINIFQEKPELPSSHHPNSSNGKSVNISLYAYYLSTRRKNYFIYIPSCEISYNYYRNEH